MSPEPAPLAPVVSAPVAAPPVPGAAPLPASQVEAVLSMQRTAGNRATARFLARDAADDEIEKIESEKLSIGDLIDRCRMLPEAQREAMIGKAGAHAGTTDEERLLACLLVAKFTGKMKRADFQNTYGELLAKLPPNQRQVVLEAVGKATYGKTISEGVEVDKRSINDIGMKGAPGSSLKVGEIVYVVVDGGVQFKTSKDGGPGRAQQQPGQHHRQRRPPAGLGGRHRRLRRPQHRRALRDLPHLRGRPRRGDRVGQEAGLALAAGVLQGLRAGHRAAQRPEDVRRRPSRRRSTPRSASRRSRATPRSTAIDALGAMQAFVDGQEKAEGFTQSNVKLVPRDSSELPQEVRDFVGGFDTATDNTNTIADKVAAAP